MNTAKPTPKTTAPGPMREDEIMELVNAVMEEDDPSHVPQEIIPEGYSVEWKRLTVLGQRMPDQAQHEIRWAKTRWEPVHLDAHPSFRALVPDNYDKNTIENGGRILMIRPKEITDKVEKIQEMKAKNQLTQKMAQVSDTGSGEAPRKVLGVKRSYEASVEVPND